MRINILVMSLIAALSFSTATISSALDNKTITMRADSWCPFNCEPGTPGKEGILIDVARKIFSANNISVDYQLQNWARAKEELRKGKIDAIVGAYTSDGPDFLFLEPIIATQDCFWRLKGTKEKWHYDGTINSIKSQKIGATQEYSYGRNLDGHLKALKSKVQYVGGDTPLKLNLAKLSKGRIDVMLENEHVIGAYFANRPVTIEELGCEPAQNVYIAFSGDAKNESAKSFAKILSEGIKQLKASGELKKIMDNYGLTE